LKQLINYARAELRPVGYKLRWELELDNFSKDKFEDLAFIRGVKIVYHNIDKTIDKFICH
jgi:hypothetical protein